jgi:uncharacterized protein DUF6879
MPDLAWWLQNFKHSAFRLETLPQYLVPQEEEMLARFKRGEEVRMPDDHPWLVRVRQHVVSGKAMRRVRVVTHPLTDYLRFELAMYHQTVAAGEDIRVCSSTEIAGYGDWWLFDDRAVVRLIYDEAGHFLGTDQDTTDVVTYCRRRDLALEHSIPFADYATRSARQ